MLRDSEIGIKKTDYPIYHADDVVSMGGVA
jgi:hypothetical protein